MELLGNFKTQKVLVCYLLGFRDFFESIPLQLFVNISFKRKYEVEVYSLLGVFPKENFVFSSGPFKKKVYALEFSFLSFFLILKSDFQSSRVEFLLSLTTLNYTFFISTKFEFFGVL